MKNMWKVVQDSFLAYYVVFHYWAEGRSQEQKWSTDFSDIQVLVK